jgi:hypothetical protein
MVKVNSHTVLLFLYTIDSISHNIIFSSCLKQANTDESPAKIVLTRENSIDSASSLAELPTQAASEETPSTSGIPVTDSNAVSDVNNRREDPVRRTKPKVTTETTSSSHLFLEKESTVETVESGKSKVNQLLAEIMAKKRQPASLSSSSKTIDLFENRSLFNNTKSSFVTTPSNPSWLSQTIKNEAVDLSTTEPNQHQQILSTTEHIGLSKKEEETRSVMPLAKEIKFEDNCEPDIDTETRDG